MKKIFLKSTIMFSLFFAAVLFSGCGGAPLKVEPADKGGNPSEMVAKLGKDLQEAKADQMDVLSPTWYARAVSSYTSAKQGLEKGVELSKILDNIAKGRAELQQAGVVTLRSRDQLADAIAGRKAAQAVNAQQFAKDYADVESDFLKLTKAMDESDFSYARSRQKAVGDRYRELELRAISNTALGDVRQLMAKAEQMKVDKIAPKSYAEAKQSLAEAETFIGGNRYDQKTIRKKAADARFMVERSLAIAESTQRIEEMPPEDISLSIESLLSETRSKLNLTDQRNAAFKVQQTGILSAIGALQKEFDSAFSTIKEKNQTIQNLSDRLAEVEGTSQRVKYDKDRLAEEKRFNEQFVIVQGYFTSEEAEVYKKYNQLIIRLKGIQFPVGQAVIVPSNYDLLTKVQKAIVTFGQPDVVIEGHTDSTGSQEKNQALSEQRAQSVRQYLVANGTLPSKKITAVGYGFSKPIAPNETAEGRAQNRRIDVIIKPEMKRTK